MKKLLVFLLAFSCLSAARADQSPCNLRCSYVYLKNRVVPTEQAAIGLILAPAAACRKYVG